MHRRRSWAMRACSDVDLVLREHASRSRKRKELILGVSGLVSRSDEFLDWLQRDLQPGGSYAI